MRPRHVLATIAVLAVAGTLGWQYASPAMRDKIERQVSVLVAKIPSAAPDASGKTTAGNTGDATGDATANAGHGGRGGHGKRGNFGNATIPVRTAVAARGDLPVRVRSIGFAEPVQSVAVRARIESQLTGQMVTDGQTVSKGDIMFRLDDRQVRAQAEKDTAVLDRDRATLERAKADLDRQKNLAKRGVTSAQALDKATADMQVAAANVKADEATVDMDNIQIGYATIRAPISGRIGAVQATPGNLIRANDATPMVTITQIAPIRVALTLPQRYLPRLNADLAKGDKPEVRLLSEESGEPFANGPIDFVDSSVDVQSGTISVKATFANAGHALWPNQYFDVDVALGKIDGAVTVPTVALQQSQSGTHVFVERSDSTVELRKVTVATTQGDVAAISSGLAEGDRVVTEGVLHLTNGSKVSDATRKAEGSSSDETQPGGGLTRTARAEARVQ